MTRNSREVAAAYDTIAADYDRLVEEDQWMRRVLWSHYRGAFTPGSRLLELGCGTGLDTLFLAEQGHNIAAVDVSLEMIERLRSKLRQGPAHYRVETQVQDVNRLAAWPDHGFDGIVAAFAALNTIDNLTHFASEAARLLRPDGRMVLHLLAPAGVWEQWRASRQSGYRASKTLRQRRERTLEIGGYPVRHHVFPPAEARRLFASYFRSRRVYGLGFLWPRDRSRHIKLEIAQRLGALEARLGSLWPFLDWGRFFVLDLERR